MRIQRDTKAFHPIRISTALRYPAIILAGLLIPIDWSNHAQFLAPCAGNDRIEMRDEKPDLY